MLPPDAGDLEVKPIAVAAGSSSPREQRATTNDPEVAQRQETKFHGVSWGLSYDAAFERARAENKPVLVDFTGTWCQNCRLMEQYVFPKPEVIKALGKFVTVSVYVDSVPIDSISAAQREKLAEFPAIEFEQHVAMPDLLLRHLVVHRRRVRIGAAQPIRKRAIDAVVLIFVGNGERQDLLLAQVGEAFHDLTSMAVN